MQNTRIKPKVCKHQTHKLKVSFTHTTLESKYIHEVQVQDANNIQ